MSRTFKILGGGAATFLGLCDNDACLSAGCNTVWYGCTGGVGVSSRYGRCSSGSAFCCHGKVTACPASGTLCRVGYSLWRELKAEPNAHPSAHCNWRFCVRGPPWGYLLAGPGLFSGISWECAYTHNSSLICVPVLTCWALSAQCIARLVLLILQPCVLLCSSVGVYRLEDRASRS